MEKHIKGIFLNRPNRFIAEVEINGEIEEVHVPNTGRCKELLIHGVTVYLIPSNNPKRKTKFTLHYVLNRGELVSIYSQEANKIVFDAISDGKIKELSEYNYLKREKQVDNSRIDIYLSNDEEECFVEVKGVTLVNGDVAMFPDAPTERGSKHLNELIKLKKEGKRAIVFFLVQHPIAKSFKPNWENDPVFSKTLNDAYDTGVEILVYKCKNSLEKIELIPKSLDFDLGE
ncbi:DNA/RNA nuclease SfsA [Methanobrevibacter sp. DSM 116169]|uniref:DNA/RNA nuclease SfsA n=1 Tax=Methanobrevibacter sp. DSM 116169 TaxID=3242727 RepID=UPI0038FD254E